MSKYGVISGPYFPVFGLNTVKYVLEITPNLNTFHAMLLPLIWCLITLRIECSNIGVGNNITYNIRNVINVSRKSVRPTMEFWRTPTLSGYSWEDFLSRTTQSLLLLRKDEIRSNIWPEIPQNLSLGRRPACQTYRKLWIYQVLQLEQPLNY